MTRYPTIQALRLLHILQLLGIFAVLFTASILQFVFNELPCPLCLLQRIGLFGIALGFLMNLRFGLRASHYAIALFGALFTGIVALRQVALHVIPGTGAYGDPLLGFHLYTWVYIISIIVMAVTIIMQAFDEQYTDGTWKARLSWVTNTLFLLFLLLIATNVVSVFLECGFTICPDDPTGYEWLKANA